MKKVILTVFSLLLLAATVVLARGGGLKHESRSIDSEGAKNVVIIFEFGAGEVVIEPKDMDQVAEIDIEYNPRRVDYDIEYEVKGSTGYLDMESIHRRKTSIDTDENIWNIALSTRYPATMSFEMGACEAELDLGGIPIRELNIEIGAASAVIEFSEVNPERLEEISIEAGACSMELISFGNANFERLIIEGGVGSFEIDLRGEYRGTSYVEIEIGLGSADITLPRGVAVRIETDDDGWLSSIDIHRKNLDEIEDGVYESEDFEDAENRIVIEIEVGLGSIDVYWKR